MNDTPGSPNEVPSSLQQLQEALSEWNRAITFPKASQLYTRRLGSDGDEVEAAPAEENDVVAVPAASQLDEQELGRGGDVAQCASPRRLGYFGLPWLDIFAPTSEQPTDSGPRHRRRWRIAGLAAAVAIALTIGANTPIYDAPDRNFAMAAIPVAPTSPVDEPIAGADESGASPTNWSDRAAELQFVIPAVASPEDALPIATAAADAASAAQVSATSPAPAPVGAVDSAVRGVSDKEIRFGMVAPFSGAARELGREMKIGVETAFDQINDAGGLNGRQLQLVAADDGYEPARTVDAMQQLYDKDQAFGFIGNVGTPTAAVALPFALDHRLLFFGAFTGASILRRDPPDRYVFNYRASYAEETDAVVRYLVKVRRIQPREIMVFAQQDAYGDSGYAGVAKAVRTLPGDNPDIVRVGYKRNTVDVQDAVTQLRAYKGQIKAVVMVASYRAAAKFIEKTRDLYPALIYTNVSFVGSTALADELMLLGPRYATGVVVTQVVPAVNSYASIILKYKTALAKYFPGESVDYVSLEGYIDASILAEAIRRVGPQITTERLVDELERMRDFDMGLGTLLTFSPNDHQSSHKVWGTQLDEAGHYQAIDLQ